MNLRQNDRSHQCPLCCSADTEYYLSDRRDYFYCTECDLIFVPESFHLSQTDEKAEYDKHENDLNDAGYLKFLNRTIDPLKHALEKGQIGLDFGCGPAPLLAKTLTEAGFPTAYYDLYYFNDSQLLTKQYDFITCTEVIEHIKNPIEMLSLFQNLLAPSGTIAIMTKRVKDKTSFATWHYKNDPTHICFYSEKTFNWVAQRFSWQLHMIDNDVVFLSKRAKT